MTPEIYDDVFGQLRWDPLCEHWKGQYVLTETHRICITVGTDGDATLPITPEARAAFHRTLAQQKLFTQKAADDLLGVHNEGWHHVEDTPPLNSDQFQNRLTLTCIHVESWGSATSHYDDGDLFWGHLISVHQEADGSFEYEAVFEG